MKLECEEVVSASERGGLKKHFDKEIGYTKLYWYRCDRIVKIVFDGNRLYKMNLECEEVVRARERGALNRECERSPLAFGVQGSGFRVQGLRVEGWGLRVEGW